MKRIRKTKEEREEIRKFKREERQSILKKEKRHLNIKKEYFILIFAVIMLVILVVLFIYMIFFSSNKKLIVPDVPEYEELDVGVSDGTENDLNNISSKNIEVNYSVISDYYGENILLSSPLVEYLNDSFIVTSSPYSDDTISFISSISLDGKLNWLTKLNSDDYGVVTIYKTFYLNNEYYVFGITENESIIVITVSKDGKKEKETVIVEETDEEIMDVIAYNEEFYVITDKNIGINIYQVGNDLSLKNNYSSKGLLDDEYNFYYGASGISEDNLRIACSSSNYDEDTLEGGYYIMNVALTSGEVTISEFSELNKLDVSDLDILGYADGFVAISYDNNIIYKYDANGGLVNKYDYGELTLEILSDEQKEVEDDGETVERENTLYIEDITITDENIIIKSHTVEHWIYDVFDSNLNITKRYTIDYDTGLYDEAPTLTNRYINGKFYEIYMFGDETPSILISTLEVGE